MIRKDPGPTQGFFTLLLEKNYLLDADRQRGRFRSFPLIAVKHFLANEWDREHAQSAGGQGADIHRHGRKRDGTCLLWSRQRRKFAQRRWALSLLEHVMAGLRAEFACGQAEQFEKLSVFLIRMRGDPLQRTRRRDGFVRGGFADVGSPAPATYRRLSKRRDRSNQNHAGRDRREIRFLRHADFMRNKETEWLKLCLPGSPIPQTGELANRRPQHVCTGFRVLDGGRTIGIREYRSLDRGPHFAFWDNRSPSVLSLIGEGGMGAVYEAGADNLVERRTQIIRPAMANPELLRRFERNRRPWADCNIGIAQIYEAGMVDTGFGRSLTSQWSYPWPRRGIMPKHTI
jgi:hypothetical protein